MLMEWVMEVSFSKVRCSRLEFSAFEELSFWAHTHTHRDVTYNLVVRGERRKT